MNRVIGERLTSGRSTARSIASASTTIAARVTRNARANGTPRSSRLTKVSAANSTIAPWAKLNTPEAL
ncbi:hypothetical protein D3C78_1876860 [compost metagenome]